MKAAIVVVFVMILVALAMAGRAMLRRGDDAARPGAMWRALAWRIGLSVALFLCLLAAWRLGWIRPTGVPLAG
jgi:Protein of unknown function (DUF2909)